MEIRELRSFVAAARLRSVSRAAEALDLGQPGVSTHIKKLETELRTPLFDRVKRPILLTLAGADRGRCSSSQPDEHRGSTEYDDLGTA